MNKVARMIVQDRLSKRDSANHDRANDRNNWNDATRDAIDQARRDGYSDGYKAGYDRASYEIKGEYDKEMDEARRRSSTTGRYMKDRSDVRLSNAELSHWEHMLRNADGTKGKHFDMHHVNEAASKMGIRFDSYSEKEFCMTMNMLYSDFCEVCRSHVSPEKEAHYYAKMAQAWLEDDDGPAPSEKLALYYYCIVADDE